MSTFADRLSSLRKKRNLKQREMAELMGISLRAWQYYESGEKMPDVDGLAKIAEFFGVSTDYLLGKTDHPQQGPAEKRDTTPEQAEFLRWVAENVSEVFFYDFDKSPEESKKQLMADLRYMWEREKKKN